MRPAALLPPSLGEIFTVDQALAAGVSAGRLRGRDLVAPFRNVRARGQAAAALRLCDSPPTALSAAQQHALLTARAQAFSLRMQPGEHFSHSTAALLWGLPLPTLPDHRIHVTMPPGRPRRHVRGVWLHSAPLTAPQTVLHRFAGRALPVDAPVAHPISTWLALGRWLGLHDLVAVGDAVVRIDRLPWPIAHRPTLPPLATTAELAAALETFRGHGRARLQAALPLLRTDSWSRPESLLRLHLGEAGLPEPKLNIDIFAADTWLACVDGAWPRWRVYFEYHGAGHFTDRAQVVSDIDRRERLAQEGWVEVTLTAEHVLKRPQEGVARVRAALIRRGWRG